MRTKPDLCREEDAAWAELNGLWASLTDEQILEPGFSGDGWSVKDLMAHVASWQAEAERGFQQIRVGTFVRVPLEVDAMNARFLDANRDQPLPVVRSELAASRSRMLAEFSELQEVTVDAEWWFFESGANHYLDHVKRLREWVEELRAGG